jgi:hypothetical protein
VPAQSANLHYIEGLKSYADMTVEAFDQMSEEQKLKVLMNTGSVVSERKDDKNRSFLYYVNSFYVIVKYNLKTDELVAIDAFNQFDREERIQWRILRVLPGLQQSMRGKVDGLL